MQERRQRHQWGRGSLGSLGGREHQCAGPVKEGGQNVVRTGGGEVLPRVSKGRGGAGTGSGGRLQSVEDGGAGWGGCELEACPGGLCCTKGFERTSGCEGAGGVQSSVEGAPLSGELCVVSRGEG